MALGYALPVHADAQQQESPTTLDAVEVVGRAESGAYHAGSASGAKADLPLRELPQSVRIITRQAIDDLGATKLDDVLDYVGGISRQNNFGGMRDNIVIRGLPGNQGSNMVILFNGLSAARGAINAPLDLTAVERIEFLKGPAAALYGSSEPGGILHIVSKRPLWTPGHSIETSLGSQGIKRAAVDSTAPIGRNLAYRVNAAIEERDGFRDHVGAQRKVFAPALTWNITDSTRLEYVGEVLRHQTPMDRGTLAVDGRLGAIPRDRFLGEPDDGDITVDNQVQQLLISHDINPQWRARLGLSYRESKMRGFSTEPGRLQANGDLWRERWFRDFHSEDWSAQAEIQGTFQTGVLEHEIVLGSEYYRLQMDRLITRIDPSAGNPYLINIYNPVYGQPQPVPVRGAPNFVGRHPYERQYDAALYVQDVIRISPQWRLMTGLRVDRYRQSEVNQFTRISSGQRASASAPRLGLSWLPTRQWTLYASAGRSFRPNAGADFSGRSFAPERGQAMELGGKWESTDQRMGLTAALFDIKKRNVVTVDPLNPGFSTTAGELGSRGIELDFAGQISEHWRLNTSVVQHDVKVRRDNNLQTGERLVNVPKVNASVLAVYESSLPGGQRYGLGGGLTHTGERLGESRTRAAVNAGTSAFYLPAYTTGKLVAYLRMNPSLRLTLDVDNLFDRTYYTSSLGRLWVTPGAERSITLGLQTSF